jgi:hypothetical protein
VTIPFPKPQNASEARGNMMYWAEIAERTVVAGAAIAPSMASIEKAKMWAAIALTMPEVEFDHRPMAERNGFDFSPTTHVTQDDVERVVAVIRASGVDGDTIPVDSTVWNALRTLAMRHVASMPDHTTVVHQADVYSQVRDLVFTLDKLNPRVIRARLAPVQE